MSEFRIVTVLSLGFGLVGIDRFLITTLYPMIARDLGLDYSDLGLITGALAVAWGFSALFMGNLSDRVGRRPILVTTLVIFSLLIGASGLAMGLLTLIAVRVIMGLADGAFTPVSIAGTLDASGPTRRGLNIGIQQTMMPLFGLGLAPLLVAYVLNYVAWRYIFLLFVLPGLALAYAVSHTIPPPVALPYNTSRGALADWKSVLGYPNVRFAAVMMLCWLTCLITTSAFMPNYLIDHIKLEPTDMARVMSAIGLGAMVGTLLLPWLSDRIGRRRVMILSSFGVLISLLALTNAQRNVGLLFGGLFAVHFFNNALIALTVGPLCTEGLPVSLMATASGLVIAVGEVIGGGAAPVIVGQAAKHFGISHVLWLPVLMTIVGIFLCVRIRDIPTRPPSFSSKEAYS